MTSTTVLSSTSGTLSAQTHSASPSTRRIRVLHVVETMEVGGMERMIATLCRAADSERFEMQVLVTRRRGALGEALAAEGIHVGCAGVKGTGTDYFALRRLLPHIRGFRPDVVHTHATHALVYGGIAAAVCRVPRLVHTEHGRVFPDKPHLMMAERWLSRALVTYVTVSESLADAVNRFERVPRNRITVIPNGVSDLSPVDGAKVRALREAFVEGRQGPVIGAVARLVWEKGLNFLLGAWAKQQQKRSGERFGTLVIAGDGPERENLERLAANLGITESVRFLGTVTDIGSFYRVLDGFVLSSVSEGLPMAILEAMAAGLPIIATRVGAIPEALGEGTAGVLVNPSDEIALAEELGSLIAALSAQRKSPSLGADDFAKWREIARAGRQRFEASYTAKAMASRYSVLYSPSLGLVRQ